MNFDFAENFTLSFSHPKEGKFTVAVAVSVNQYGKICGIDLTASDIEPSMPANAAAAPDAGTAETDGILGAPRHQHIPAKGDE